MCLAADVEETLGGRELVDRLPPVFQIGDRGLDARGERRSLPVARRHRLRLGLDYLRYSDPRYEATPKIRERAWKRTPTFVLALAKLPFRARDRPHARAHRGGGASSDGASTSSSRSQQPDLVLITPLIELGSPQLDYVRAARRLGIPSALCVGSWDHLSSKALIRVVPDAVMVWNETQRLEADRFHGIPPESRHRDRRAVLRPVVRSITGAGSRRSSAARMGLPAGSAVHPLGVLRALPGQPVRIEVRPQVGRRDPPFARSASSRRRSADQAASAADEGVGAGVVDPRL